MMYPVSIHAWFGLRCDAGWQTFLNVDYAGKSENLNQENASPFKDPMQFKILGKT